MAMALLVHKRLNPVKHAGHCKNYAVYSVTFHGWKVTPYRGQFHLHDQ